MMARRRLLRVLAGGAAGAGWAADLRERDPARLREAAVRMAVSGDSKQVRELAGALGDSGFLRRLDPEPGSVGRLESVFQALAGHPSAATEVLCLRVAASQAFAAVPARWNLLLRALATVRPMRAEGRDLFLRLGRSGFVEVAVPLLAQNASAEALGTMAALLGDETLDEAQRVQAAHWGIPPNRLREGVAAACGEVLRREGLAAAVDQAIVESLFEYRPAEWFGKRSAYPEVPAWKDAGPAVRNDYRRLGTMLLARPRLEGRARESIDKAMALLPGR